MHPLLRRLAIRGPIMFLALAGMAWGIGWTAERFIQGLERGSFSSTLWAVVRFSLVGTAVYAFLEWAVYLREKSRQNRKVD